MAFNSYTCRNCGHVFEEIGMSDVYSSKPCPACGCSYPLVDGTRFRKLISTIILFGFLLLGFLGSIFKHTGGQ
jgi:hypothetical protein